MQQIGYLLMLDRKIVWHVLRVGVAAGLLAVLAWGVDWQAFAANLSRMQWLPAGVAFLGITLQFAFSAWKWGWALRLHGLEIAYPRLLHIFCVGFFFNHFLPSAIGGDAYRAIKTMPKEEYGSRAFSAVIVERVVGFAVLIGIAGFAALYLSTRYELARAVLTVVGLGAVAALVLPWMVYRGSFKLITNRVRHTSAFKAVEHNIGRLRRGGRTWLPLMGISLLFHVTAILIIYLLFLSLNAPMPLAECVLITAAMGIAGAIPLSINGLGVVEGSMVGTAVALGGSYETAIIVALMMRLLVIPHAAGFGLLYALRSP